MPVTKEQEEDFKKRFNRYPEDATPEEIKLLKKPSMSSESFLAFLNATDKKCD